MCVIIHSPAGIAMPTDDILDQCWSSNRDGAGVMFVRDNVLHCHKGFMTLANLKAFLQEKNIQPEEEAALHFRIKTSGEADGARTHPFPVGSVLRDMKLLEFTPKRAFMHNGVFGQGKGKCSDTMLFNQEYFSLNIWEQIFDVPALQTILEKFIHGSRVLLMENTGKAMRFGTGWTKDTASDLWFSNSYWKRATVTAYGGYNSRYYRGDSFCEDGGFANEDYYNGTRGRRYYSYGATKAALPQATEKDKKTPACPICKHDVTQYIDDGSIPKNYYCTACQTVFDARNFVVWRGDAHKAQHVLASGVCDTTVICNICNESTLLLNDNKHTICPDCEAIFDFASGRMVHVIGRLPDYERGY